MIKTVSDLPREPFQLVAVGGTGSNPVTNDDLALLKDCKSLYGIDLIGCKGVTDGAATHIAQCKNVKYLNFATTQFTDAGLARLKDLKNIDFLVLDFLPITNEGLGVVLREWTGITMLQLAGMSKITDEGLAAIKNCKGLKKLRLDGTRVSDAGLAYLTELKQLTDLDLTKTRVTAKGVQDLAKSLPKCKITWDGGTVEGGK